jgi:hypothetical protein
VLFVCYLKCTACQKAQAFLDARGAHYEGFCAGRISPGEMGGAL